MKAVPLLVAMLALGGCSNLLAPSGAPAKLYTLSAAARADSKAPQVRWQLLVAMPDAALDLNNVRIALAPAPTRIDYYADVTWADRPPAMLQALLLESFDNSGRISAVQRQSSGLKSDFVLTSNIQDFQVETFDQPIVHIGLTARLIRTRDRTIVASRRFETTSSAGANFDGAIAAFDTDLQTLLPQIVDWTLNQGAAKP